MSGITAASGHLPNFRVAQMKALALPAVGMASAFDWGDMGSPNGNIHPRWKAPVGARLAIVAAPLIYGPEVFKHIRHPTAVGATFANGVIRVQFDAPLTRTPPITNGVRAAPGGCQPEAYSSHGTAGQCAWFAVDGVNTTAASVTLSPSDSSLVLIAVGATVVDRSRSAPIPRDRGGDAAVRVVPAASAPSAPRQVSYGWGNWPVSSLWGQEGGFPALPFFLNVGHDEPVEPTPKSNLPNLAKA